MKRLMVLAGAVALASVTLVRGSERDDEEVMASADVVEGEDGG